MDALKPCGLILVLLVAGCAGPAVRTETRHEPPAFFTADRAMAPVPDRDGSVYEEDVVTLIAVGDLMFGRRVEEARQGMDGTDPLEAVREALAEADLTFGNLECVLGREGDFETWKSYDKIRLGAPAGSVRHLKSAGFDVVSLGNNHVLDFGKEGLGSTVRILEDAGIGAVGFWRGGVNKPCILKANGVRVAFLSYSDVSPRYFGAKHGDPGTIPPLPEILKRDIPAARKKADRVVVSVHWGREYQRLPTPKQRRTAHLMVDLGADVVLGHHPHVLQPFERYRGGFIAYSLGNFLFDLNNPLSHESMVLKVLFDAGKPGSPRSAPRAEWAPVTIRGCFPAFLTGGMAEEARRAFPVKLPRPAPEGGK